MHTNQQSGATFVRIEIGLSGKQIAVFSEGFNEFALNASSIETRIRNLAKYGHPCIAEHAALAELKRRANTKAD